MSPSGNLQTQTHSIFQNCKLVVQMLSVTSLLFASSINTLAQTNTLPQPSGKTSQVNQLNLAQSVSLDTAQNWLNATQFNDLRSVTALASLDLGEYQLPIMFEFDLKNAAQTKTNYTKSRQAMVDNLTKAKNEPAPTERKFNRQDLLKMFDVPADKLSGGQPLTPPTEEELQYYETNGTLPPIQVNEQELRAKAKELNISVIPHLDKTLKGKFTNARIEDRLAIMTPEEKQQNDQRVQKAKVQSDLVQYLKTSNPDLTQDNGSVSISQLTYITSNQDQSANNLATKANKSAKNSNTLTKQEQQDLADSSKPQKKTKSLECSTRLESCIESIVFQDTTGALQADPEQQDKIKADNLKGQKELVAKLNKHKKDRKSNPNLPNHQFNSMEAGMYLKEGIDVKALGADVIEDKLNSNQQQKSSWIDSILNQGSLKTEAKGLNNSYYSLILYATQNNNLAINFDYNYRSRGKIRNTNGSFYSQRFIFDNNTNQIRLDGTNQCLEIYGGNFTNGGQVWIWDCHSGANQKWIFDEEGRIASITRTDLCLDSYGGLGYGADLGVWGCHSYSSQNFRAGDYNFGTGMGMTMWAADFGNWQYNLWGHAFVETWNNSGTRNTFSRWDFNDDNCSNSGYSNNNICDHDAITVDTEIDIIDNNIRNNKYGSFRKYGIYLNKSEWDYLVFGSGYRNNYWRNSNVDMGGGITYYNNGWISMSRHPYYTANYGYSNLFDVCSGYSIKLWNAYRGNARSFDNYSPWVIGNPTPATIYYQI